MSKIIEDYYKDSGILPFILKEKLNKLERNVDVQDEFEYWIKNKAYKKEGCVKIKGYTAEKIAGLSKFLDGEGAFMLLIELRENPEKALKRISEGFKLK